MKKLTHKQLVLLSILGAWAFIMRLFDFPIIPSAPFLRLDFSDVVVMIGLLLNGPIGAVIVALMRDTLGYLMRGGEMGLPIGACMSLCASFCLLMPMHYFLKRGPMVPLKMRKVIALGVITPIVLTVIISLVNYYITIPIYIAVLHYTLPSINDMLLMAIIPFNLIKGVVIVVANLFALRTLYPLMLRRGDLFVDYRHTELLS